MIKMYNADECQSVKPSGLSRAQLEARNTSLKELITRIEHLSSLTESPILLEASLRLDHVSDALINLEHALFYVRMYRSTDNTGEGEKRRQQLIDDSEFIINLIRKGGLYQ